MLHVLSAFITANKELCCEEVKMQKRYDSQNAAFDVYSHFNWEEYKSDDEESMYSEDDNESEKVVSSVAVDYITFTFSAFVCQCCTLPVLVWYFFLLLRTVNED